ncbi:MAG: response regulator transcription factor [Pseudomonadota bacterium]
MDKTFVRLVVVYAPALALLTAFLEWIEYRYLLRQVSGGWLMAIIATMFVVLGIWLGLRLSERTSESSFTLNTAGLDSLGISPREHRVLELIADGQSNKEIARTLDISPNTVKTHVAKVFTKLEVSRRTEAVNKSRLLRLIP